MSRSLRVCRALQCCSPYTANVVAVVEQARLERPGSSKTGCSAYFGSGRPPAHAVLKVAGMSHRDNDTFRARHARLVLGSAVLAALLFAHAPQAHASGGGPTLELENASGVLLGLSAIGFGGMDLFFLAADRPPPLALSILQITIAGMIIPLTAVESNDTGLLIGAGISSAWFIGHGVFSIQLRSERQRERQRALLMEQRRRAECEREHDTRVGALLCTAR